ncbi:MAG: iron ABC transporter permease [Actinomycetota bacterium]|nr:iron ABC transporter permease [Actinomycetota bacterium]
MGAVDLGARSVLLAVVDRFPFVDVDSGLNGRQEAILWELRMPRVALGGIVGAMLAVAGGSYQGSFRNPLADPYLLGAAAGAGLGATIAIAYGASLPSTPVDALPLLAFVGGVGGVAATYAIGYSVKAGRTPVTLILAGVAVAAFLTAVQTYLQQRNAETLREVYGWILGRLSTVGWGEVWLVLPYVIASTVVILLGARRLDVLSVGDDEAVTLGVDPSRVRLVMVLAATLGTAAVVAVSGLIGFVGIIVPHAVRIVFGSSYRVVLPLSVVFGATFLILADLLARTIASPAEIPIGVVTAFFGAPFFAIVLRSSRGLGS